MKRRALFLSICAAFVIFQSRNLPASQTQMLGSGRSVEILNSAPLNPEQGTSSYLVVYETSHAIDDLDSLRIEADELIDSLLRKDPGTVYRAIILEAFEKDSGKGSQHSRSTRFVYQKKGDSWRTEERGKGEAGKMDEPFIRLLMKRLDWIYDHNEMIAYSLYLGDHWTMTMTGDVEGGGPRTIDRESFINSSYRAFASVKEFHHRREILKIRLREGGKIAEVESREIEEGIFDGKYVKYIEQSRDLIQIDGAIVTLLESTVYFNAVENT